MSTAIRLQGGLGNICFQLATGETWRKQGFDVVYTNMDENLALNASNYSPKRHTSEYKSLWPNFHWDEHKAPQNASFKPVHVPFVFTPIVPKDGTEYIGYFQSEKNFPDHEFIKWLFMPWVELTGVGAPPTKVTCSIHVRRQDYLKLSDYHFNLGKDYYTEALKRLEDQGIERILVFSDDIEWCKNNMSSKDMRFVDENEYICLYLMGKCTHNIIANSSLSWWGAWLGETPGTKVVAPKSWFGPKGQDSKDIIPERWIKI